MKNTPSSNDNGYLDWKACKIRAFQSFCFFCDVNMMLEIEPVTFPQTPCQRPSGGQHTTPGPSAQDAVGCRDMETVSYRFQDRTGLHERAI
mgnify:CR=1 FL=1